MIYCKLHDSNNNTGAQGSLLNRYRRTGNKPDQYHRTQEQQKDFPSDLEKIIFNSTLVSINMV